MTIRALTPVMVDGGTRVHATLGGQRPRVWAQMLAQLRRADTPDAGWIGLPTWGRGRVTARFTIGGTERHILTLHAIDRAWWRMNLKTGEVHLQWKAKGLWAHGYRVMADRFLGLVTWLETGRRITVDTAHRVGWRMSGLEICADFAGLRFYREDAMHFLGGRMVGEHNPIDPREIWGGDADAITGTPVETINVGRRTTSPLSACIYDKVRQIESVKAGDGSTYQAAWRDAGWTPGEGVCRVEMRFNRRALAMENPATGEILDFTNPATAADAGAVSRLWAIACHKRRLIVPDTATRRERCDTDPRWDAVSEVGATDEPHAWRQLREVQKDTHRERVRRARRDALKGLQRFAALVGADGMDPREIVAALAYAVDTYTDDDLGEYATRYAEEQREVLGPEIEEAHRRYRTHKRARLGEARARAG